MGGRVSGAPLRRGGWGGKLGPLPPRASADLRRNGPVPLRPGGSGCHLRHPQPINPPTGLPTTGNPGGPSDAHGVPPRPSGAAAGAAEPQERSGGPSGGVPAHRPGCRGPLAPWPPDPEFGGMSSPSRIAPWQRPAPSAVSFGSPAPCAMCRPGSGPPWASSSWRCWPLCRPPARRKAPPGARHQRGAYCLHPWRGPVDRGPGRWRCPAPHGDAGGGVGPHFSPDGRWIAFTSAETGPAQVHVIDRGGGESQAAHLVSQRIRGPGMEPRRDPGPLQLRAAVGTFQLQSPLDGPRGGRSLHPSPGAVRIPGQLLPRRRKRRGDAHLQVGSGVAGVSGGQNVPLVLLELETLEEVLIPGERFTDTHPVWMDGKVYFLSDRDAAANVWSYDVASGALEQLTFEAEVDIQVPLRRRRDAGLRARRVDPPPWTPSPGPRSSSPYRCGGLSMGPPPLGGRGLGCQRGGTLGHRAASRDGGPGGRSSPSPWSMHRPEPDPLRRGRRPGPGLVPPGGLGGLVLGRGGGLQAPHRSAGWAGGGPLPGHRASRMAWNPSWSPRWEPLASWMIGPGYRWWRCPRGSSSPPTWGRLQRPDLHTPRLVPRLPLAGLREPFPQPLPTPRGLVGDTARPISSPTPWPTPSRRPGTGTPPPLVPGLHRPGAELGVGQHQRHHGEPHLRRLRHGAPGGRPHPLPHPERRGGGAVVPGTQKGRPGRIRPLRWVPGLRGGGGAAADESPRGPHRPGGHRAADRGSPHAGAGAMARPWPVPRGRYSSPKRRRGEPGSTLHLFSVESREARVFAQGVGSVAISGDGARILFQSGGQWRVVDTARPPDAGSGRLTVNLQARIDPEVEWRQIFDETWRMKRTSSMTRVCTVPTGTPCMPATPPSWSMSVTGAT